MAKTTTSLTAVQCFHCGEDCNKDRISAYEKNFCCSGCKMVFEILDKSNLCDYYSISKTPGTQQKNTIREGKFSFLDDKKIAASLTQFQNENRTHINFYLPQIHCSSCLWLLENLHRLDNAIISSKVNFERKEVDIVFSHHQTSLRKIAELLSGIGYEPYLSFNDMGKQMPKVNASKIYKLGIAGFCFANIMLMSFPEYFGIDTKEYSLLTTFRFANLALSLPVFFYSATEFYVSAWKSIKHRFLNIDAPIVLAIWVTFGRSIYEVLSGTGGGYFDSMSGIVFFMLVGRVLQDTTYRQLSFERDYTSYFPIAVTRVFEQKYESILLSEIKLDDTLLIHHEELIPSDGILTRGKALIDYSFVTGETAPVEKEMGEIVYAGGKQLGSNIELLVIKEVAQSYLTKLWNKENDKSEKNETYSFVHLLSRYFTWIVFGIAFMAAAYWYVHDISKVWNVITSILIIACPCALFLSNTFTNGNILRRLSRNHLYLRNAEVIERMASIDCIVFDKTGTLTTGRFQQIVYEGEPLSVEQKNKLSVLASQSVHPLSKAIVSWTGIQERAKISSYKEVAGYGIEGIVGSELISLGSYSFITKDKSKRREPSIVYVAIEEKIIGKFIFRNQYREQVPTMLSQLGLEYYHMAVLSGDNDGEKNYLQTLMGSHTTLLFNQDPIDKLKAIKKLQESGKKVMMIGDGLNDAGALTQADVGIAISETNHHFTPASDGILSAEELPKLYRFIQLCKANKKVVVTAFVISIFYNIIGLSFAVSGSLSPIVAAILMPSSSISIVLITFGLSNYCSNLYQLK